MSFTKKTRITYIDGSRDIFTNTNLQQERTLAIVSMIQLGKTDGRIVPLGDYTFERYWIDQSAAEEWINITRNITMPYGDIILSTEIVDLEK